MRVREHDIAVCSWSLAPDVPLAGLARLVRDELGLAHVHLAVGDLLAADAAALDEARAQLDGLTLTAGQVGFDGEDYTSIAAIRRTGGLLPDDENDDRGKALFRAGEVVRALGGDKITFHAGAIPPVNSEGYPRLVERVRTVARPLHDLGVDLLLETGQSGAPALLQFLNDVSVRGVGVNLDAANMVLYGSGDPIEAVRTLARHVRHVHVKDALVSEHPGVEWGVEVPLGKGQVAPGELLEALDEVGYAGPLAVERLAGPGTVASMKAAVDVLKALG